MGLSIEFYAGEPQEIGRAFTACELDEVRNGNLAHSYVDLSLHLSLEHLDLLSEAIASARNERAVLLLDSLEEHVGGTDGESSADVVAPAWVEAMAATPDAKVRLIAEQWMKAVALDVGDPSIEVTPDCEAAVASLVALCREAVLRRSRVVCGWYP